jgi:hypothetical protein
MGAYCSNQRCDPSPEPCESKFLDEFVRQCLAKGEPSDWVSISDVRNAYITFFFQNHALNTCLLCNGAYLCDVFEKNYGLQVSGHSQFLVLLGTKLKWPLLSHRKISETPAYTQ